MNALSLEYWAEQLSNALADQKGIIREKACETLGLSKDALYRKLKSLAGKAAKPSAVMQVQLQWTIKPLACWFLFSIKVCARMVSGSWTLQRLSQS